MIRYVRRFVQVSLLTVVLLFGTLLIMTSFESSVWSECDHQDHATYTSHEHIVNNGEVMYIWPYVYGAP